MLISHFSFLREIRPTIGRLDLYHFLMGFVFFLTTPGQDPGAWWRHCETQSTPRTVCVELKTMNDAIFVLTVVAFFVISGLYVRFCEKL